MSTPNLFCRSGRSVLSDSEAMECALEPIIPSGESPELCECCGAEIHFVYRLPDRGCELRTCSDCFTEHDGPARVRDEAAKEYAADAAGDREREDS